MADSQSIQPEAFGAGPVYPSAALRYTIRTVAQFETAGGKRNGPSSGARAEVYQREVPEGTRHDSDVVSQFAEAIKFRFSVAHRALGVPSIPSDP